MTQLIVLGDNPDSLDSPAVVLLDLPPGYVLFRHAHICHRFEVVVKGSLEAEGRIWEPGDIMTAGPGEWYGPHIAGPDGCTTMEVFGTLDGVFRVLAESDDGAHEFDFRKGEIPRDYEPLVRGPLGSAGNMQRNASVTDPSVWDTPRTLALPDTDTRKATSGNVRSRSPTVMSLAEALRTDE
jgi:hypothetical protein